MSLSVAFVDIQKKKKKKKEKKGPVYRVAAQLKIAQPSLNLSLGVPYFENWRLYNKNLVLIWLSLFEFGYVSLGIVLSSQVRFGC